MHSANLEKHRQLGTDLWFLWRLAASRGEGKGQEDAQGSVSPLWVCISRVWAPGAYFAEFLEGFHFPIKWPERCARVDFPPSGSYGGSLSSNLVLKLVLGSLNESREEHKFIQRIFSEKFS